MAAATAPKTHSAKFLRILDDAETLSTCTDCSTCSTPHLSDSTGVRRESYDDSCTAEHSPGLQVVVKSTFIDVADAPSMKQRYKSLRKHKTDSDLVGTDSDSDLDVYLPGKFSDEQHATSHVQETEDEEDGHQQAPPAFQIQIMQVLVPVHVHPKQAQPLQMQPSIRHADIQRQSQPLQMQPSIGHADMQAPASKTTVMMRNLPNNYTRGMFLGMLNKLGFAGCYDFVYLPFDFKRKANLGYAFINLLDSQTVGAFWKTFDGFSGWSIPSSKVCKISWSGPHQGLQEHVERYRNSPVMHEGVPDDYKPMIFANGIRQPFPPPTRTVA